MYQIRKYILSETNKIFTLQLAINHQILSFQVQNNEPCLWVLDGAKDVQTKTYTFMWHLTGDYINRAQNLEFVGTVLLDDGNYVLHLFLVK